MARVLLTIAEAADALGVSKRHVERLVAEADANRKSRWRWGRELIDLAPLGSSRRTVRVNLAAVVPGSAAPVAATINPRKGDQDHDEKAFYR